MKRLNTRSSRFDHRFEAVAEVYLEMKKSLARGTYDLARWTLKTHLVPYFGKMDVREITEFDAKRFIAEKSKKRTTFDLIKHFKGVMNLARSMGVDVRQIKLRCPDQKPGRGKIYTRDELADMLWKCRGLGLKPLALQIRMAYSTGMRRGEILKFKYEYLQGNGWVYLPPHALKTRMTEDRAFPLSKPLLRIIRARMRRRGKREYLFETRNGRPPEKNNKQFMRLRRHTKIEGVFHELRNTHATWLVMVVPEQFALKMLGMTARVLKRYVNVPKDYAETAVNKVTRVMKEAA